MGELYPTFRGKRDPLKVSWEFLLHPWHAEVPGPGIEPVPQQQPKPPQQQPKPLQ